MSRRPRFFVTADRLRAGQVTLSPSEARHVRVRRLVVGDPVALFDGEGHSCDGVITAIARGEMTVAVTERLPDLAAESPLTLTLAVAMLKADRMDWVIEKATELGATHIVPFTSRYSLARPSSNRRRRWQDIARSAAKQSGRSRVPGLHEPTTFDLVVERPADERLVFWEAQAGQGALDGGTPHPSTVLAVVGPEGGFTREEAAAAVRAGCRLVSLGPRILRAETAAVAAVALCQHVWGDGTLAGSGAPP